MSENEKEIGAVIPNGDRLVACVVRGQNPIIYIELRDENDDWVQDLVMVEVATDRSGKAQNRFSVMVWEDPEDEGWTHHAYVDRYQGDKNDDTD